MKGDTENLRNVHFENQIHKIYHIMYDISNFFGNISELIFLWNKFFILRKQLKFSNVNDIWIFLLNVIEIFSWSLQFIRETKLGV